MLGGANSVVSEMYDWRDGVLVPVRHRSFVEDVAVPRLLQHSFTAVPKEPDHA